MKRTIPSLLAALGLTFAACGDDSKVGDTEPDVDAEIAETPDAADTAELAEIAEDAEDAEDAEIDASEADATPDAEVAVEVEVVETEVEVEVVDASEVDASPDAEVEAEVEVEVDVDVMPEVVAFPQIALAGPDGPIVDGLDDAGEQEPGVAFTRTYTIANTGTGPLAVSGISFPKAAPANCDVSLALAPDAVVAPGGTTSFDVASTVLDDGVARCPFTVDSDDPDAPALTVTVAALGVASAPISKKAATATCGTSSGFGFIAGVLSEFTPDGTLVTTDTQIDNCIVTRQVGTLPGGPSVINGADTASCNSLTCSESDNLCNAFGGPPYSAGGAVTVTLTDVLLGGPVTHAFAKAPGTLSRSAVGASQSRGAPLVITTSGGLADTLTLVTIQQQNPDGQTTVICEYPAESASVTVPTNILALFHDGAFDLLVDTRVQAFSQHNGFEVVLVVVNSTTPQQSTFTP